MKSRDGRPVLTAALGIIGAVITVAAPTPRLSAQQPSDAKAVSGTTHPPADARKFDNPQQAADALVDAAAKGDMAALEKIFGAEGKGIVLSGDASHDREHVSNFATLARESVTVSTDSAGGQRAFLLVGNQKWPFPVPVVKSGDSWSFDADQGREELYYRRMGANELDAIELCRGFVEAQNYYALERREGYQVHQYAQRIISTPGKQDGLAWRNPDGSWGGVVGDKIAHAIQQGYTDRSQPYHGYYYKILTGQGPAAPLGEMDFIVEGAMIGGFALAAAPAKYGVTGVQSFIVSYEGVVYQKDLGPKSLEEFQKLKRYNPDKSWTPVPEQQDDSQQSTTALR